MKQLFTLSFIIWFLSVLLVALPMAILLPETRPVVGRAVVGVACMYLVGWLFIKLQEERII